MAAAPRRRLAGWLVCQLGLLTAVLATLAFSKPQAPSNTEVPVVKGGAGPCSVDFVVTDASGKGLFDAKIRIQIKYRFGGFHKLELEVGTNSDGKARVEGLPEKIKKPAAFTIRHGDLNKTVPYEPEANCHARQEVTLGEKPTPR